MATLPLYQPTGYIPADIPRLDYANLKEQANQLTTITSALDRVSNFAFKRAAEQAEREGLQYGAENQPSAQQVMAALERGESPQELFAKPGTVFGDAARKVQAGQLRSELEVLGRKKLADLSAMVDAGSFNLKDVQQEITSQISGYARAISSISPEEGLKFRASMGTAGAGVYSKAAERAANIYNEGLKVLAKDSINTTTQILSDMFMSESDPAMIVQRTGVERTRVYDVAARTNDVKFVTDTQKEFTAKVINAMVDYLSKPEVSKNSAEVFSRLESGDVGKLSGLYKTLDKNEIIAVYAARVSQRRQIREAERANEKLDNEKTANNLLIEYFSPTTNQLRKTDIGRSLARMNVLSVEQMERFLNPDVKDGDPYAFADIRYKVRTGIITDLDELRGLTTRSGFSGRQYSSLANDLIERTGKDEGSAYKLISQASGFGDVRPGKSKNNEHQFKKEEIIINYYNEAKQASILDRGSFNAQDVARAAINRYNETDRKDVQKTDARNRLAKLTTDIKTRKKLNNEFVIDETTNADDLLQRKIINNDEYAAIVKQQNILRKEVQ